MRRRGSWRVQVDRAGRLPAQLEQPRRGPAPRQSSGASSGGASAARSGFGPEVLVERRLHRDVAPPAPLVKRFTRLCRDASGQTQTANPQGSGGAHRASRLPGPTTRCAASGCRPRPRPGCVPRRRRHRVSLRSRRPRAARRLDRPGGRGRREPARLLAPALRRGARPRAAPRTAATCCSPLPPGDHRHADRGRPTRAARSPHRRPGGAARRPALARLAGGRRARSDGRRRRGVAAAIRLCPVRGRAPGMQLMLEHLPRPRAPARAGADARASHPLPEPEAG